MVLINGVGNQLIRAGQDLGNSQIVSQGQVSQMCHPLLLHVFGDTSDHMQCAFLGPTLKYRVLTGIPSVVPSGASGEPK